MRLVYIALAWTAGIVLAANSSARLPAAWLILTGVALLAAWLGWPDERRRIALAALVAFTLGGLRLSLTPASSDVAQYNGAGGLTLEGVVTAEPDVRDSGVQLQIAAESVTRTGTTLPTSGLVLVDAPPTVHVQYGDRITATGLLVAPAVTDAFSYSDYLARQGVYSIMQNTAVEVLSSGHGSVLYTALLNVKDRARQSIAAALPEPQAGLLSGILLGDRRGISPEVQNAFSATGVSHILIVSGFNMVILSEVVTKLLRRLRVRRWLVGLIGIAVIVLYTAFVGASASVVRAALMSSLLVVSGLVRRKTYVPASLAFVALAISLADPLALWDVGFQLSFFATLGMALFTDPLETRFNALLARLLRPAAAERAGDLLTEPVVVSIAAQVLTLPLMAIYFGQLSLVFLVVNLLIVPVQSALMLLGGLATLVAFVLPQIALVLYWLDLPLLSWTLGVVRAFAALPFAQVDFHLNVTLVAVFYAIVIGWAIMQATKPEWWLALGRLAQARALVMAALFAGLSTVALAGAVVLSRPDKMLHVWLLDMGESDAVLVETPGGADMLVDGGRFPSRLLTAIGDRLPFNKREIDLVAITQPDENEFGALPAVLDRYETGLILTNGQPNQSDAFQQLQAAMAGRNVLGVQAGYTVDSDDGVHLEVLNPQSAPDLATPVDDAALVFRLSYGQVSFLLTSDLSKVGQTALLDAGQWPAASVIQLPQHGTARSLSEDFLRAVQPQVALVQSDPANRRGDPNPDTLALLQKDLPPNVPIFRTDRGGTIHLWTDGENLWEVQES